MPLNAIELVELRMLERGGLAGSDGRDWLRITVGAALTSPAAIGVGLLTEGAMPTVLMALLGIGLTCIWITQAERKVVAERIKYLRSLN